MPIRSPRDVPTGTVRDLGLPERAVNALARAGVTSVADLAALTRRDLAAIDGLGPGMIAAIRLVVPEPSPSGLRTGGRPEDEEESPAAPEIPSFESLRDPRHRTAIDLLVPQAPPPAPAGAPRPAEYGDLLRLGVRAVCAVAGVPGRMVRWTLRQPAHCLRRLR